MYTYVCFQTYSDKANKYWFTLGQIWAQIFISISRAHWDMRVHRGTLRHIGAYFGTYINYKSKSGAYQKSVAHWDALGHKYFLVKVGHFGKFVHIGANTHSRLGWRAMKFTIYTMNFSSK